MKFSASAASIGLPVAGSCNLPKILLPARRETAPHIGRGGREMREPRLVRHRRKYAVRFLDAEAG
jgi:hypothetical protein